MPALTLPLTAAQKKLFRDILEAYYLSRMIPQWRLRTPVPPLPGPGPAPDPAPFGATATEEVHALLHGDLLRRALAEPQPQPSRFSVVDQLRADHLHIDVVKDLIDQFESGLELLREELKAFEAHSVQGCS